MNLLEKYLIEDHPSDQQDIIEIEKALKSAVILYDESANFDAKKAWPYALTVGKDEQAVSLSHNTTAMIVNSLLRFRGFFSKTSQIGDYRKNVFPIDVEQHDHSKDRMSIAIASLLKEINVNDKFSTISQTYGPDDIFTLAWLSEISGSSWLYVNDDVDDEELKKVNKSWAKLKEVLIEKVTEKLKKSIGSIELFKPLHAEPLEHAFPVLRLVQAAKRLDIQYEYDKFYDYFESSLHEQLSFSSIPDSRFDPAELMFCLEGMLLCQSVVDRTIFDRVLEVLKAAQNDSAFWRPVKPFLATKQGAVIFPVSVEIANSLMRCCVLVDNEKQHDTYGSKCIVLLRRYWQWLRARAVTGSQCVSGTYIGWHSEHVNQTRTVHLWETSQVMEFLMSYRNMLHLHIARTTLELSRFKVDSFSKVEPWNKLVDEFEPVSNLYESLSIYKRIGVDFIDKRNEGGAENYSMLLYGPPGTGKTTVAKSIAKTLGYRMITITVSDFLASGGAQVEARAKNIFTVLMAQPDCVVLFDEIDHFLLDRDSARYSKQDTLFQFMTPGMLTKIADLRSMERVLFIVATNYEDRIDPAIKRTGRIDKQYLLLPPDREKRLKIIVDLLKIKKFGAILNIEDIDQDKRHNLADSSLFLGYPDIKAAVQIFLREKSQDLLLLGELLKNRTRTITLAGYQSRFIADDKTALSLRETPMNEFMGLLGLVSQCDKHDIGNDQISLKNCSSVIKASMGNSGGSITTQEIIDCNQLGILAEQAKKIKELF